MQGAAIDRIIAEIIRSKNMDLHIDYVMCIGHFLSKVDLPAVTHNFKSICSSSVALHIPVLVQTTISYQELCLIFRSSIIMAHLSL